MILVQILAATFIVSLLAFVGIFTFYLKKELLNKILLVMVSLSAGALLGGAFFHLLPEAIDKSSNHLVLFMVVALGFCLFYVMEQFLRLQHEHGDVHDVEPFSYLILVGDTAHNFIDGLVIAAAFIVAFPVGIATTLAVVLHEIPHELGDYACLIYGGMQRKKALMYNYISAVAAICGGVIGYFSGSVLESSSIYLLAFAAGNFLYIATVDLIPEFKHRDTSREAMLHFGFLLAGLAFMLLMKIIEG